MMRCFMVMVTGVCGGFFQVGVGVVLGNVG